MLRIPYICNLMFIKYRAIKKDGLNWKVNSTSTQARQLVAVFQVPCSLYGLTCVGYAQNSLEFVSRSPRYTWSAGAFAFTQTTYYSNLWFQRQMLFLVGGWMLKRRRNLRWTAVADSRTQKILCCIVAILLSTDAAARLCIGWEL